MPHAWRRPVAALGVALVLGAVLGWVHGTRGGLRADLGNLSAPWLLLAAVAAWFTGGWWRGALLGTASTMVALVGFYAALSTGMHGHLGPGVRGPVATTEFVVDANLLWFAAGAVSGPVVGAVSGYVGRRADDAWLVLAGGLVLVGEPLAVAAASQLRVLGVGWSGERVWLAVSELLLGAAIVGVAAWRLSVQRARRKVSACG